MNYGIVRIEKIKMADGGGLRGRAMHSFRQFSNVSEKFDPSMTSQNEYFGAKSYEELKSAVKARWSLVTDKPRTDAVGVLEIVVTTTAGALKPEQEQDFFATAMRGVASLYGEENLVATAIHRDETTPHAHFFVVPLEKKIVKTNSKKMPLAEKTTLNAKKITGGKERLSAMQDLFYDNLFKNFGLARGEKNSPPTRTQRSSLTLQTKRLNEREKILDERESKISRREKTLDVISKQVAAESRDRYFHAISSVLPDFDNTYFANETQLTNKMPPEKNLFTHETYEHYASRVAKKIFDYAETATQKKFSALDKKLTEAQTAVYYSLAELQDAQAHDYRNKTDSELQKIIETRQRHSSNDFVPRRNDIERD